jgi:hypothetical protein
MNLEISEDMVNRINNINFFHNCGNVLNYDSSMNIKYVESWKAAESYYTDPNWETTTLEAGNRLTVYLSKNYPNLYNQKWNEIVRSAKSSIIKEMLPALVEYTEKHLLNSELIESVKWDILSAVMEYVYKDYSKEHTFFLTLLEIYEAGNFPCGWIGTWPEGSLVVY